MTDWDKITIAARLRAMEKRVKRLERKAPAMGPLRAGSPPGGRTAKELLRALEGRRKR